MTTVGQPERRRPRRGSVERPVSGRIYRGTWLVVAILALAAAFSVTRPPALPAPQLPPVFDASGAVERARELARLFPDRSPGSPGARTAARWVSARFQANGLTVRTESWRADIPGRGNVLLRNLVAVVPGRTAQAIVVTAHRDNSGAGPGANDNASGTATLLELARTYANPGAGRPAVTPAHTIVLVSSDGAIPGALGARRFADRSPYRRVAVAVVNLDSLAGHSRPRLQISGDEPSSPAGGLVETAAARIFEETGDRPDRTSVLGQLVDLAFPFSLYEQAPFVGRGVPAITLTTAGDRRPRPVGDVPERLDTTRLGQLGRTSQALLESLDEGLELAQGTSSYLFLGVRIVRGWAIQLVLVAALLPVLLAAIDLYARCRRRRVPLAPAFRSYRSRLYFWIWVALVFELFRATGVWPELPNAPIDPASPAAGDWPRLGLLGLGLLGAVGWLIARARLVPRRVVDPEEELAGHTAALLVLLVVALLVIVVNPFALLFVLPSLHAWLWLPQVRQRSPGLRVLVLLAGFAGPLLLLGSFAVRFGLGLDAPWYLLGLTANGYVPTVGVAIGVVWLAAAGQLVALSGGRYAPYPGVEERPPRGPVRSAVRAAILAGRALRRAPDRPRRALEE